MGSLTIVILYKMQKYIDSLVEDIKEAKRLAPPPFQFSEEYEEFESQMLEAENTPPVTSEQLMDLSPNQFPPSDKLTDNQMIEVINTLEETFDAFCIYIDLPDGVPTKLHYELLCEILNEDINLMPGFTHHYDFCSGYCPDCKISTYCNSKIDDFNT